MTRSKQSYVLMAAAIVALTAMILTIPSSAYAQCFGNPHDDGSGNPHDFQSGPNGNPHNGGFHDCPGQGTDQNPNK